jgi:hypothetical protein
MAIELMNTTVIPESKNAQSLLDTVVRLSRQCSLNSLGNGKIVTQKVNLARLAELTIHQSKDRQTGGHLYDTPPRAVTMSCLGKRSYWLYFP